MAESIIIAVAALSVFLLWWAAVSLLVRPFGVRLPLAPFNFAERRRAFQTLTSAEYMIIGGILVFGCGMFIARTFSRFLEWKYFSGSSDSLTASSLLRQFVGYLMGGLLGGLISGIGRSSKSN